MLSIGTKLAGLGTGRILWNQQILGEKRERGVGGDAASWDH